MEKILHSNIFQLFSVIVSEFETSRLLKKVILKITIFIDFKN